MIALRWLRYFSTSSSLNTKISKLVPPVKEEDLSEQFVKGSGPGGQNVNKNTNCVVLKHLPTGVTVKCHISRLLHENRRLARELLAIKVDNHVNGEFSVENQMKIMEKKKKIALDRKKEKLRLLKENWKKQEGL